MIVMMRTCVKSLGEAELIRQGFDREPVSRRAPPITLDQTLDAEDGP